MVCAAQKDKPVAAAQKKPAAQTKPAAAKEKKEKEDEEESEDLALLMLQEPEVDAEEDDDESEDGDLKAVSDRGRARARARVLAVERLSVLTTEDFVKAVEAACLGRPEVRHQLLSALAIYVEARALLERIDADKLAREDAAAFVPGSVDWALEREEDYAKDRRQLASVKRADRCSKAQKAMKANKSMKTKKAREAKKPSTK